MHKRLSSKHEIKMKSPIKIQATIKATPEKIWEAYTQAEHIVHWNFASPDWHCPSAEVDLKAGGQYKARMEAKDGSFGFDFLAVFDEVIPYSQIHYTLGDGRKVKTRIEPQNDLTKVETLFEPESENPRDLQEQGWQAILNNFKNYVESIS